jgi:hypothetical protein
MFLTRSFDQHLLFDASKARSVLGWEPTDPVASLSASVKWHRAHPPVGDNDFGPDDAALGP